MKSEKINDVALRPAFFRLNLIFRAVLAGRAFRHDSGRYRPPAGSGSVWNSALAVRRFCSGVLSTLLAAALLAPASAWACACGCGVFDVATSSMLPQGAGGMAFLEYDFQNQNQNWSGSSNAPSDNNADKVIRTSFYTAGLQYMFNRTWGAQIEVPYDSRVFQTTGGASGNDAVSLNWHQMGDIRIKGIYTGFSEDLSAGLTFGLKLPSGSSTHNDAYGDIDRDTEIGSGSTDLLLGGFFRHNLQSVPGWTWFGQVEFDQPFKTKDQYRPGAEFDAAAGVYSNGWAVGGGRLVPVLQAIASARSRDSGANSADPVASGYQRLMLSPGIEFNLHPTMVYADVELPVLQHFTGNQLAAPALFKVVVSYMF